MEVRLLRQAFEGLFPLIFSNCPIKFLSINLSRYNNPLHMFAESFLDRTRAAARYFL